MDFNLISISLCSSCSFVKSLLFPNSSDKHSSHSITKFISILSSGFFYFGTDDISKQFRKIRFQHFSFSQSHSPPFATISYWTYMRLTSHVVYMTVLYWIVAVFRKIIVNSLLIHRLSSSSIIGRSFFRSLDIRERKVELVMLRFSIISGYEIFSIKASLNNSFSFSSNCA